MGEIAKGVPPHGAFAQGAKTCFVFCCQSNVAFRPIILHRFRPFLKQQTWIAFRMRTPVKIFQFMRRGFSWSQNSPKYGTLGAYLAKAKRKMDFLFKHDQIYSSKLKTTPFWPLTFDLDLTLTSKFWYPPPKTFVLTWTMHVPNLVLWASV